MPEELIVPTQLAMPRTLDDLPDKEQASLAEALAEARHAVRPLSADHAALEINCGVKFFRFS